MTVDQTPFADVLMLADGFSIPELKWRELLFIGALKPEGDHFVRDPKRPFPEFHVPGLFPEGVRLRATRAGGRIRIQRL